jgi:serine/threonine protein kinase
MDEDIIEEELGSSQLNLTRTVTEEVEDMAESDGGDPEQYNSDEFEEDYEDEEFEEDEDHARDAARGPRTLAQKLKVEEVGQLRAPLQVESPVMARRAYRVERLGSNLSPSSVQREVSSPINPLLLSATRRSAYSRGGKKIKWKKGEMIGSGSFGDVFKALNMEDGSLMAVKEVCFSGEDEKEMALLRSEINVMRSLRNQHIVSYLGTEIDGKDCKLYIFQEWVAGGSVKSILDQYGPLSESIVVNYTTQVLLGLNFLHSNQIVHRDIKGSNLLVDDRGTIKLADFGTSKRFGDLTMRSDDKFKTMCGTPYFLAPEVALETGHGIKADIWSLGGTVLQMLTAEPPWKSLKILSPIFLLQKIALSNEIPPFPKDKETSKELEDFLLRCFVRDPKRRPNTTVLLQHPFVASAVAGSAAEDDYVPAWVASRYPSSLPTASAESDGKKSAGLQRGASGVVQLDGQAVARGSTSSSVSSSRAGTRAGSSGVFAEDSPAAAARAGDGGLFVARPDSGEAVDDGHDVLGDTLNRFDQAAIAAAGAARFSVDESVSGSHSWSQQIPNTLDEKREFGEREDDDDAGSPGSAKSYTIVNECDVSSLVHGNRAEGYFEVLDNTMTVQNLSPGEKADENPFARGGTNDGMKGVEIARKYNAWSPNSGNEGGSEDEYVPAQDNNESIDVTRETFMKNFGLDEEDGD